MNKRQVGNSYEQKAADYLTQRGYDILEYNYHDKYGEIDLIGKDGGYLVFVEVKYRANGRMGEPAEAVTLRKQQRIRNTARFYLYQHGLSEEIPCRFDVISFMGDQIKLIQDAF